MWDMLEIFASLQLETMKAEMQEQAAALQSEKEEAIQEVIFASG